MHEQIKKNTTIDVRKKQQYAKVVQSGALFKLNR